MPGQVFSDPVTGQQVVTLSWDMAQRAVDVDAGGTLLTRVTDIATLKQSGMQGQTALGEFLSVKVVDDPASLRFEVSRNGHPLDASHVNFGMAGPRLDGYVDALNGQREAQRSDGLAFDEHGRLRRNGVVLKDEDLGVAKVKMKVDPGAFTAARWWVGVFAVIQTLFVGLPALSILFSSDERGSRLVFTIISFALITLFVVPWWVAFGLSFSRENGVVGYHIGRVLVWLLLVPPLVLLTYLILTVGFNAVVVLSLGIPLIIYGALFYYSNKALGRAIESARNRKRNIEIDRSTAAGAKVG